MKYRKSAKTFSILDLIVTLSITTLAISIVIMLSVALYCYAECHGIENIRLAFEKSLTGTNTLAYLVPPLATKKIKFRKVDTRLRRENG